jgi:hypothetical protein
VLGVNARRGIEQIIGYKNDFGNGYTLLMELVLGEHRPCGVSRQWANRVGP